MVEKYWFTFKVMLMRGSTINLCWYGYRYVDYFFDKMKPLIWPFKSENNKKVISIQTIDEMKISATILCGSSCPHRLSKEPYLGRRNHLYHTKNLTGNQHLTIWIGFHRQSFNQSLVPPWLNLISVKSCWSCKIYPPPVILPSWLETFVLVSSSIIFLYPPKFWICQYS